MFFTLKNYDKSGGLSRKLFMKYQQFPYIVSGPYGKGLGQQSEGIHIAFAAGTGILTFMDLVAQVARSVIETRKSSQF